MKYLLLASITFTLLFYSSPLLSQSLAGIVTYTCILNLDTSLPVKDKTGKPGLLFINEMQSSFNYNYQEQNDTIHNEPVIDIPGDSIGDIIFKDLTRKKITMRQQVWGTPYIIEEPLPAMNWRISNEKKTIGNFSCQKAVTRFRGRAYEAWFTKEVPVATGPWKFHGLPGLVLQASDSNHEIVYTFVSIIFTAINETGLLPPTEGIKIDFETYKTIWQKETNRLKEFLVLHAENGVNADIKTNVSQIEKTFE